MNTYVAERQTLQRFPGHPGRRLPVIAGLLLDRTFIFATLEVPPQVDALRSIEVVSFSAEHSTDITISSEQMQNFEHALADHVPPDCLVSARFAPPSSLFLQFADKEFVLPIERLQMPVDRIDWPSVVASPFGEKMTVKGIKGDAIPIDSSFLRYLVDAEYASETDAKLKSLQFTENELETMVRENQPPDQWFESSEPDLRRESWK